MKKFITSCPMQRNKADGSVQGLELINYDIDGNSLLEKRETHFPIIPVIYAYAKSGEKIQVIILKSTYETTDYNYVLFVDEIRKAEKDLKIEVEIKDIITEYKEDLDTQLKLFSDVIECFNDEDELYVCITYGTKPTPIVQMMAVNYAYRILQNVKIECIVYGQANHVKHIGTIFDVTALFFMDEVVNNLSRMNIENPTDVIKRILNMEE